MTREEERKMLIMDIWITIILILGIGIMISFAIAQKEYLMLLYFLLVLIPASLLWGGSTGVFFLEKINKWRKQKKEQKIIDSLKI